MEEPATEVTHVRNPNKGLRVEAGAGIEWYSGTLANKLNLGPTWGLVVGAQPLSWMGLELGYTGGTTNIDTGQFPGATPLSVSGADFVRNGGDAIMTLNIPGVLQPYALAGIGIDWYNYRGIDNAFVRDDSSGRVPLGGGIRFRSRSGHFVADARFQYNVLWSQDFVSTASSGGSFDTTLSLGAKF